MSLQHFGDWVVDEPDKGRPSRLYHLHKSDNGEEKKWKILSGVFDGQCRTCGEEAPKSLRFRVAFWGISGDEKRS